MDIEQLVEHWTVLHEEQGLVAGKHGATRLAFTCLLKFYTRHGRFPQGRSELADEAGPSPPSRSGCPVPAWFVQAAQIVLGRYAGDAAALWSDHRTAVELRRRLEAFPGIGQKKAAMAVEILARDLGKPPGPPPRGRARPAG